MEQYILHVRAFILTGKGDRNIWIRNLTNLQWELAENIFRLLLPFEEINLKSCLIRVLRRIRITHLIRIIRNTLPFNNVLNIQGLSNHT